ncbi:MAG: methylmalonyl Co-A mutase-associated GTPase MeaB, partial [Deltaproteobacteria bacterium]|nr:methylmalonyl Co-A mutase-associated GTPase MeaB [Deltaproteobacteria bacterium]
MTPRRPKLSLEELRDGVLSGNRGILARAITLMESSRPADQTRASNLLTELMPHTGNSIRVGITGVPGVGKSTFIE